MSKNRVQYDMDTSEGLMPLIQALIKPPEGESKPPGKKPYHHYRKRQNNDACDSCGEGGALICCDRCVSSFHLGCHDPPLEEQDIPNGLWICHTCKMTDQGTPAHENRQETVAAESSQITKIKKMRNRSNSRKNSATSAGAEKPATVEVEKEPEDVSNLSPLDQLIRAARILNPRQFELPREINSHFPFPGTEKQDSGQKNGNGKRGPRGRKVYELDGYGLVPLPAKTCHTCGKSCRRAPLIACDYCDLFFHQDCLDPPLTALPTSMWMCPNHVEQFIDWKLVNSVSATERMKLWNHFNSNIDQDTVKNEFFRKVHRRNPPFRVKQRLRVRDRIEIPPMIEYHYQNPPDLLPSLRELLRAKKFNRLPDASTPVYDNTQILGMIDTELEAISGADAKLDLVAEAQEECTGETKDSESTDGDAKSSKCKTSPRGKKHKASPKKTPSTKTNEAAQAEGEPGTAAMDAAKTEEIVESKKPKIEVVDDVCKDDSQLEKINEELKSYDDSLIKMLAYQRLQQILSQQNESSAKETSDKVNVESVRDVVKSEEPVKTIPLPSQLLTKDDIERIAREFTSPKRDYGLLADISQSNLSSIAPKVESKPHEDPKATVETVQQKVVQLTKTIQMGQTNDAIRVRAVMTPVDVDLPGCSWFDAPDLSRSVYMRYRSFSIGTGRGNDVQLSQFGTCQFISEKHATIFYDEVTKMFELLNYSEHGTTVNGQLFSCDFTAPVSVGTLAETTAASGKKGKKDDQDDNKDKKFDKAKLRKEMMDKIDLSRHCTRGNNDFLSAVNMTNIVKPECGCVSTSKVSGWEGTAILHQGSFLKFGCLSFLFTITDYDNVSEEFDDTDESSDEDN